MLDQLRLLVDEAEALGSLLGSVPEELIHGRPLDTMPSIAELLAGIAYRDRTIRQRNLNAFLSPEVGSLQPDGEEETGNADGVTIDAILADVRNERRHLVALAEKVAEASWDRVASMEDRPTTPLQYLNTVVQADAATLRQIAERIFESRPAGSPGLSRH